MKQAVYGLLLYGFLVLPPVAALLESIMIVHMHMQMPLLVLSGIFMARFFQIHFPRFFEKWNKNGVPGVLLFMVIWSYWMIPRMMDETLSVQAVEVFKFISLPFLAGVSLRDSWSKLGSSAQSMVFVFLTVVFLFMAWIYIGADKQICNNYLEVEQKTLGWGSLAFALIMIIYFLQLFYIDQSEYK
ncbi:hypothetical protein [Salibacterium aidingense]|uniref:hypothetical protein n=1 Tax=Salibacterium aidingense TaxID=384933 RepID=UPI00040259FB|nr:hypothetical protein [Salibacterium aidingense]